MGLKTAGDQAFLRVVAIRRFQLVSSVYPTFLLTVPVSLLVF